MITIMVEFYDLNRGITKNYSISICTHINVTMIEGTLTETIKIYKFKRKIK